jgi:peroxin-10
MFVSCTLGKQRHAYTLVRAHQRDHSQVHRIINLASEIARSIAGTRWLAHRQTIVDISVRAAYLFLTFGRGQRTLGEEYTDILPYARDIGQLPSRRVGVCLSLGGHSFCLAIDGRYCRPPGKAIRLLLTSQRRLLTIIFLLLPTLFTSPAAITHLRDGNGPSSRLSELRARVSRFLESPVGQAIPEIHMIAFLFWGRFLEMGKRLAGISYVRAVLQHATVYYTNAHGADSS